MEKKKFYSYKTPVPLRDVDIEKVLVFVKKTINTLLVTCKIIIRLSYYIYFLK